MSQGRLPVDGVALLVEGQKKFVSDLNQATAAWNKTISGFDKASGPTSKAGAGLDQVGQAATGAGSNLLSIAGAAGIAIAGLNILVKTLGKVANAFFDAMTQSLQLAGQFQEMEFTALAIGRAMGLTEAEIRGASKEIQDLGIRADVADKTVAQFARNQLDLAKATDLVRIAQATGIIINEDSSATMESLTRAITTGSTVMLRRMGIMVDNALIEQRLAKDLGITTGELGQQQVMMARTNAIIEASASLLDVYDAAMESPTKRLRSWTGRLLPELQAALGAPFLGAWSTVIEAVSNLTKALTAALSEGGALFPMMIKLGAVASIMADGIAAAFNAITNLVTGLSADIGVGVGETIEQALRWGVELVAAFAEGMVEASTTVLVQALNFISQILSQWLLGASPPKIAPGIVGWGINLMQMYLEGMTQADFGILKKIQGPLKKILEGPAFAAMSKTLAGALAGDDRGKFLETIGKAAGVFTDAVTKLAVANFDLADSVIAVQDAEDALAKSREKILDSQAEVNAATAEYNRLLRAGAADAQLQSQLGLINAAEANLRTSLDQVNVQEDVIKAAKERQAQLEAEEKLQQNVVDQLLNVNAALIKTEKTTAKARAAVKAKKGAGLLPPELEPAIPAVFDISSRIGDAIEAMKLQIKEKVKDIFKPLTDAWDEVKLDIGRVGDAWEEFKKTVGRAWAELKVRFPILQDVEDLLQDLKISVPDVATELKTRFVQAVGEVMDAFGTEGTGLHGAIKATWDFLQGSWGIIKESDAYKAMQDFADRFLPALAAGFTAVADAAKKAATKISDLIALAGVGAGLAQLVRVLKPFISDSPSPLGKGLKEINQQLQVLSTTRLPSLASMGTQMAGALAPSQMLSPVSNTNVTMNMGGNTFNSGTSEAAFDQRVQQSLRRTLRR